MELSLPCKMGFLISSVWVRFRWGCPPGKITLKYDARETCYFVRGKVKAFSKGGDCVEFGAGDLVVIPKGLSCTWDVSVAVDKFYKFDPS
ncbi:hypothetical protein RND81_12G156200 [Saponaria officinalis]|uniref:(S)-ureidoglycine aminohydrolase cupin domain-containing protein n=1 Tax=Saponaria officinalis TaxID=3572 RepID=A0AAW1HB25_SAPOF